MLKMSDIMECNVSVVEDLGKAREPLPLAAVYFIQPTNSSVTQLLEDFTDQPLYPSVHIFFSSKARLGPACFALLHAGSLTPFCMLSLTQCACCSLILHTCCALILREVAILLATMLLGQMCSISFHCTQAPTAVLNKIKSCEPLLSVIKTLKECNLEYLTVDSRTVSTDNLQAPVRGHPHEQWHV